MIFYLDTSAFVPLLIDEPTSQTCGALWDVADRLVTTQLTYIEATAALTAAQRLGRITSTEHHGARERLTDLWPEPDVNDEYLVAAIVDERLLDAWRAEGIPVIDTNAAP